MMFCSFTDETAAAQYMTLASQRASIKQKQDSGFVSCLLCLFLWSCTTKSPGILLVFVNFDCFEQVCTSGICIKGQCLLELSVLIFAMGMALQVWECRKWECRCGNVAKALQVFQAVLSKVTYSQHLFTNAGETNYSEMTREHSFVGIKLVENVYGVVHRCLVIFIVELYVKLDVSCLKAQCHSKFYPTVGLNKCLGCLAGCSILRGISQTQRRNYWCQH